MADERTEERAAPPSPLTTAPRLIHITGYCDVGYHDECAPSAAMRAAGGCECPCHEEVRR